MASLKCSNCGHGIHYHDEANGIELHLFDIDEFHNMTKSNIGIAKFRCDEIKKHRYIWRCDECGAIHLFAADDVHVQYVYKAIKIDDYKKEISVSDKCDWVLFSDLTWDNISEAGLNWQDTIKMFPNAEYLFVKFNEEYFLVYSDEKTTDLVSVFKLIKKY